MYRNLHYNIYKQFVTLWTWDENGNRCSIEIPFNPYIYVETDSNADAMSIFSTKLKKMTFRNEWERKKYVRETGIRRIFFNLPVEQQFLIDHFQFKNQESIFSQYPLKIFYVDIEVYSPNEFPVADVANKPINIITIYDSIDKKYHTWGTSGKGGGKYNGPENVEYTACSSEKDLLTKFISYWRKDYPDIITGWNSQSFDIPYIINRINNVFGEDKATLLSPIGELFKKENVKTKFGKQETHWYIKGVSHIDYMEAYKVFEKDNRERYSLNYIGNLELGEGKLEVQASELHTVADTDWQRFCDYNIQDVTILVKLENLKHYLEIIRKLSYLGYTNFEKALGTVAMVTGAMAVKALEENTIIPTFEHTESKAFVGGYVKVPQRGLNEAIISFDANSLYPNTIISANISPETKLGKVLTHTDTEVVVELLNGKTFTMTPDKFKKFIHKEDIAVTKANILYTQKKKGFCPTVVDNIYKERVKNKTEMMKLEKERTKLKKELAKLKKLIK